MRALLQTLQSIRSATRVLGAPFSVDQVRGSRAFSRGLFASGLVLLVLVGTGAAAWNHAPLHDALAHESSLVFPDAAHPDQGPHAEAVTEVEHRECRACSLGPASPALQSLRTAEGLDLPISKLRPRRNVFGTPSPTSSGPSPRGPPTPA